MYKLTNNPNVIQRLSDKAFLSPGCRGWAEYLEWIAAENTPDPAFSVGQLSAKVSDIIYQEVERRANIALEGGKKLRKFEKLHRKETKGAATQEEITELDGLDALLDQIEQAEALADTEANKTRTYEELLNFDVSTLPWPI